MLLPQNKANHFSYFSVDHKFGTDKDYNNTCHDVIEVHFSKETSFLGYKRTKEWKETFKFSRTKVDDGWKIRPGTDTLISQLTELEQGNWTKISPELYEKLASLHPELML